MMDAKYQDFKLDESSVDAMKDRDFNSKANLTVFFVSFVLLLLFGFVILYSCSYYIAFERSYPSFYYAVKGAIYTLAGFVISYVIFVLNEKILKTMISLIMLAVLLACIASFFVNEAFFRTELFKNVVYLFWALYLSLYFSKREDLDRLRELLIPIAFSLVLFSSLLLNRGLGDALVFLILTTILFAGGVASVKSLLLLIFFIAVPMAAWVLSSADNIRTILCVIVRGYGGAFFFQSVTSFNSVMASGGIFGKGLGNGVFKTASHDIAGDDSFIFREGVLLNVAEETGFIGILLLFVLFGLLLYCAYRSANHSRRTDKFISNVSMSLTFILFCGFVMNILMVLGYIPLGNASLPFFSLSDTMSIVIVECAIIYKNAREADRTREAEFRGNIKTDYFDLESF